MKLNTTLNFPWIKCFFPGLSNHQKFSLYIYSKPFTDWIEGLFYQDLNKLKYEKVHLGLSKLVWNNLNGTIFNRKDRAAAVLISLCWWQSMFEKLVEALTTKPFCRMAQWKCWVHGVVMEQCYRHQGKANAPLWGFTRERQTSSITNTAALTFEPDMPKAGVILQAWTMSTVLTNQNGPHSKLVLPHEH